MTYDFQCEGGHITALKFSTIGKAIAYFESSENQDTFDELAGCPECGGKCTRIYSNAGTVFYGEGWDKPAPSGKQFTVGSDPTKAVKSMGPPTNNSFLGKR